MSYERIGPVERMFNVIYWDDTNKRRAIVESLEKLGEKHPEALQRFLEIFLDQKGNDGVIDVATCALCACSIVYKLHEGKLVDICENPRCDYHRI